jgi:membrane peptidoglycan carboxypeptidase
VKGVAESGDRLVFEYDGVSILTSKAVLEGKQGDRGRGGSGLTQQP